MSATPDASGGLTAVEIPDAAFSSAFDVYAACREQVHEIRVSSIRNLSLKHIERLNEWRARRDVEGEPDGELSKDEGRRKEWVP